MISSKKTFLILVTAVLMACVTTSVNAQSPISFGLKGGFNIANITGEGFDADARFGFTAGAALDISVPVLPFGVESGLYYSQKGADGTDGSLKLDYLEVPVLAKFQLGPSGPITPHLVVGPYIGFNVNAESESGGSTVDISDNVNSTEFGGAVGVGIDFNLGVTKLNARAQYGYGFTDIFEDAGGGDAGNNAALSVTAGIWF
ncbi:MAG: porin family protein [Balneolaceae bacterium]|nr:porin family protein [Balneolaceae bacterium]